MVKCSSESAAVIGPWNLGLINSLIRSQAKVAGSLGGVLNY